jgi:nicotinamide mononucleotide transporter
MHQDEFWQLLRKQLAETDLPTWMATVFGVAEVLLARVNNILLYPAGIISSVISVYLLLEVKLYADAALNSYYVLISIYGWWYWARKRNEPPVPISWTTGREWSTVTGIIVIGFALCYFLLRAYTPSTTPAWDAWVSVVAWAGTWLLARRKIENWVVLNVSNLFAIPLLIYKGLPMLAVLTVILFIVAVAGFFDWRRRYKLQTI